MTQNMSVIDHQEHFLDRIWRLMSETTFYDVTFRVGSDSIRAHRLILAAQSQVFENMFYRNSDCTSTQWTMVSDGYKKIMPDDCDDRFDAYDGDSPDNYFKAAVRVDMKVKPERFRQFLRYMYGRPLDLGGMSAKEKVEIYQLAHEYQVDRLRKAMFKRMSAEMSMSNAFSYLNTAIRMRDNQLRDLATLTLCENVTATLKDPRWLELSTEAASHLLELDSFAAPEVDIVFGILSWHKRNQDKDVRPLLKTVRYDQAMLDGLNMVDAAPAYELLTENNMEIKVPGSDNATNRQKYNWNNWNNWNNRNKGNNWDNNFSRHILQKENLAKPKVGAIAHYHDGTGATGIFSPSQHIQGHSQGNGSMIVSRNSYVIVSLARSDYYINSMQFVVNDDGSLCRSYRVEVSDDKINWFTIADCGEYPPYRGYFKTQQLFFTPQRFNYVKFSSGYQRSNNTFLQFSIRGFECPMETMSEHEKTIYKEYFAELQSGATVLHQQYFNESKMIQQYRCQDSDSESPYDWQKERKHRPHRLDRYHRHHYRNDGDNNRHHFNGREFRSNREDYDWMRANNNRVTMTDTATQHWLGAQGPRSPNMNQQGNMMSRQRFGRKNKIRKNWPDTYVDSA